jgi:hypothetical protein
MQKSGGLRKRCVAAGIAAAIGLLAFEQGASARVTKIVIDAQQPLAGQAIPYEQISGRAFGVLDPADVHNQIITDMDLATSADGKVHYETTFVLTKPVNESDASGFMWHDVPNRGGPITINVAERQLGDIGLASAWQADNAGGTAIPAVHFMAVTGRHWVAVPFAHNADGSLVTGDVLGRIINRSGPDSQPLNVMGNPIPYLPTTLDVKQASLKTHRIETVDGEIKPRGTIGNGDWRFAHCDADHPWPGVPDDIDVNDLPGNLPVHICLKHGFDPSLVYQVVYPAKGAYVLGVGIAAFRDVNAFFRYQAQDDDGTPNPIAGWTGWSVIRGVSQSGNFTRAFIYLGMNQDEQNRIVHDGAWPIIAGRRVAANSRWGQPDGVLELYQMGSEGPQWWVDWPDPVRNTMTTGILHRCNQTGTCPKVIEHFGGSEVFALKMTTEWVGTAADADIPLPDNVRRYYVPSTTHGGGNGPNGGFTQNIPNNPVNCPGNNWGRGIFRANPVPETQLVNVLRLAMRNWLMNGTPPPPTRYPTLASGNLVDPTMSAMGFPHGVPGVPDAFFTPERFVFPIFDYDWGPLFNETDATGVPTNLPPPILHVIKMKVPKVDADGNELGGVPTTLRDAPLGTYLGWNITAGPGDPGYDGRPFHAGQTCNYVGGMIPFAVTLAERLTTGDPRLSLQERYGDHDGYVAAVTAAANNAVALGYLLPADAATIITQATNSDVLQ